MIGDRDEAQECVQEAFVRAWSHRCRLEKAYAPEDAPRESRAASLFACSDATALPALDTAVYGEGVWVPGPRQQDRQLCLLPSGTEARTAYESVLEAWRGREPSSGLR